MDMPTAQRMPQRLNNVRLTDDIVERLWAPFEV
jgi:hypothetical protein